MTKQRVIEAAEYINKISPGAREEIKKRAAHLEEGYGDWGYHMDLNEWLRFEIGAKEKARAWKSSALSIIGQGDKDAKNHLWRTAARAFILVEILRSWRPAVVSYDTFLHNTRQAATYYPTEQALRNQILPKLLQLNAGKYRVYTDQGSGQEILKKASDVKGREAGPAAMLTPKGTWLHQPMSNQPGDIDFTSRQDVQGIYTCYASGGCIPVAFLYGGKDGKPLDGVSLVHIPGGDFRDVNWKGMALGGDPSSIVVFLSSKNNASPEDDRKRYKKFLRDSLNYPEDLILFHLCSSGVNHGVDRWGHFGTVPDKFASFSMSMEKKVFPDQDAHQSGIGTWQE
jgi:hypothetical protein